MERKTFKDSVPVAYQLHDGLFRTVEKFGMEPLPVEEGEELIGRDVIAHAYGPRGYNYVEISEILDPGTKQMFENQLGVQTDCLFRVNIEGESYLSGASAVAKEARHEFALYQQLDFEIESLIEDLKGLWEGPVTDIFGNPMECPND